MKVKLLSCVQLCDTMDCSLPCSSVHGIFQARVLEWVAISFSRGSSQPRDWTWVSHIVVRCFTIWTTRSRCFLEFSCFFYDPADVGNLIAGSTAFSKSSLNIWKFWLHVLLKPGLENFEHYFASVWDECNCVVVWIFFGIAFPSLEWKLTLCSPVATAEVSKFAGILSAALSQHHLLGFEIAQLEFHHLHQLYS